MLQLLLEQGADIEGVRPDGKTARVMATPFDKDEVIGLLLAHSAAPDTQRMGTQKAAERLPRAPTY